MSFGRRWLRFVAALAVALVMPPGGGGGGGRAGGQEPADAAGAGSALTSESPVFRTLVVVRKGQALGSGVVVASVARETLVLTAAHVVEEAGPLHVELGRYNYGWERTRSPRGWPRRVPASVAAQDRDSDLAILRVRDEPALPFVARLGASTAAVPAGTPVASLGFDHGGHLTGFPTRVRRVEPVDLEKGGGERPFLVTDHPPEPGRSGGGLFRDDGALVGICLARVEVEPGQTLGLYSPLGNIRRLLATREALGALVAGSTPIAAIRPTAGVVAPPGPAAGVSPRPRRTEPSARAK